MKKNKTYSDEEIAASVDRAFARMGREKEAREEAQKRAQEAREPVESDISPAELQPSIEELEAAARAELQADIDILEAQGKAELASVQRELDEFSKLLDI